MLCQLVVDVPTIGMGEWFMPPSSELQRLLRESDFLAGEASADATAKAEDACPDCDWSNGDHAWLCPVRLSRPHSDGKTLWSPVCNCGAHNNRPHRHGIATGTNR